MVRLSQQDAQGGGPCFEFAAHPVTGFTGVLASSMKNANAQAKAAQRPRAVVKSFSFSPWCVVSLLSVDIFREQFLLQGYHLLTPEFLMNRLDKVRQRVLKLGLNPLVRLGKSAEATGCSRSVKVSLKYSGASSDLDFKLAVLYSCTSCINLV